MSSVLNQVTFIGNVVKDFTIRETPNGDKVVNIEVIVDNPNFPDKKTYVNLTAWDKIAGVMVSRLTKGSKVFIVGRLSNDVSFDESNNKYLNKLIVTVTSFYDLTRKPYHNE